MFSDGFEKKRLLCLKLKFEALLSLCPYRCFSGIVKVKSKDSDSSLKLASKNV